MLLKNTRVTLESYFIPLFVRLMIFFSLVFTHLEAHCVVCGSNMQGYVWCGVTNPLATCSLLGVWRALGMILKYCT